MCPYDIYKMVIVNIAGSFIGTAISFWFWHFGIEMFCSWYYWTIDNINLPKMTKPNAESASKVKPNGQAKRRGGKASPRSQNVTPRPLERTVGRPLRERKPGLHGFCSLPPHIRRNSGISLLRPTL